MSYYDKGNFRKGLMVLSGITAILAVALNVVIVNKDECALYKTLIRDPSALDSFQLAILVITGGLLSIAALSALGACCVTPDVAHPEYERLLEQERQFSKKN